MNLHRKFTGLWIVWMIFLCSETIAQNVPAVSIPLIQQGNYLFIAIKVNDTDSLQFMFDTGAEFTVINESIADNVLKGNNRNASVTGGTGKTAARLFKKQQIKIGSIELKNIPIISIPLNHFYTNQGIKMDGVIGQDLMDRFIIETNFDESTFKLYKQENFVYAGVDESIQILDVKGDKHGAIAIDLTLKNGKKIPGKFVLDTGSGSCLSLNIPFAEDNQVLQSMPATYTKLTYGAFQDVVTSNNGRLAAVQIGKYSFFNCTALIKNTSKGSYISKTRSGVVGNQILSRFNAVYDFMGKKLYLSPSKKFAAPFVAQANGMMVEYAGETDSRIIVKIINPNSPASKAGIKEGNEVLELNGVKLSEIGLQSFMQQINVIGKQINLSIKTSTGENKTVSFTTEDII